jgi:hypothetical protein
MAKTEPMDKLKDASQDALKAVGERALHSVTDRVGNLTDKFDGIANGGGPVAKAVTEGGKAAASGDSPAKGALKGAMSGVKDTVKDKLPGGGGGGSNKTPKATKATNIIEEIDVGVPVRVAYNQWTQFDEFPSFMKKVESVDAEDDEDTKVSWKAQVFWSHRTWEATVVEQIPDERIVWRSKGEKGRVDGSVTFHELGPNLTRILVVLEYYPQGFMERTGNLWRAQGRRARLELKHFRRHVMTRTILDPDEVEGWRGTIEDGEIVQTHEEALEEEQQEQSEDEYDEEGGDEEGGDEEGGDETEDEYDESEEEPEDEDAEEEPEDSEEEPEDSDEAEEPEEEYEEGEEEEEEPKAPRRRRAS